MLFVACTAALAMWWVVRRPRRPATLTRAIGHAVLALAAVLASGLLVHAESPAWWRFAGLLTVITPALVYVWLSAAWWVLVVRDARQGSLR